MAKGGPNGPSRYTEEYVNQLAEELILYAEKEPLPFLNKFALDRRIAPQILNDNKAFTKNEKFRESHALAKGWLEYRLSSLALARKIDNTMAIFCLKSASGCNFIWISRRPVKRSLSVWQWKHLAWTKIQFYLKSAFK